MRAGPGEQVAERGEKAMSLESALVTDRKKGRLLVFLAAG